MAKVRGEDVAVEGGSVPAVAGSVWFREPLEEDPEEAFPNSGFGVVTAVAEQDGHPSCTLLMLEHNAVVTGRVAVVLKGCSLVGQVPVPAGVTPAAKRWGVPEMRAAALELVNTWRLAHRD